MTNDESIYEQSPGNAGAKPVAFCQNCGRPLDEQTVRVVGPAVYCEPCLEARVSGASSAHAGPGPAAAGVGSGFPWAGSGSWIPPSTPNPGLAGLLGVIPGVGAMYNEQYGKGIFHLLVFAVLISLSHSVEIFGFFAFCWICYMVIEAYHTARARRDGTPLPNPFGLNDLGERLGFGRAWPSAGVPPAATAAGTPPYVPPVQPADPGANPYMAPEYTAYGSVAPGSVAPGSVAPGFTGPAYTAPGYVAPGYVPPAGPYPPAAGWGAPADGFSPEAVQNAAQEQQAYWVNYGSRLEALYGSNYGQTVPPVPPIPPYGVPYAPVPPMGVGEVPLAPRPSRFPAGAVWLIGLGTIFLLSTTGVFQILFGWTLVGFVLIGLAVWIFIRRMMDTGSGLGNDGSAGYSQRVVRALWGSIWLGAVGVLLLLNEFDVLTWHRSWPLFIILAGVMALLQRAASNAAYAGVGYGGAPVAAAAAARSSASASASASGSSYSIVPSEAQPLRRDDSTSEVKDPSTREGDL